MDVAQFLKKYFHIWKVSVVLSYSTVKLNFSKWCQIDKKKVCSPEFISRKPKSPGVGGVLELVLYSGILPNFACNYL